VQRRHAAHSPRRCRLRNRWKGRCQNSASRRRRPCVRKRTSTEIMHETDDRKRRERRRTELLEGVGGSERERSRGGGSVGRALSAPTSTTPSTQKKERKPRKVDGPPGEAAISTSRVAAGRAEAGRSTGRRDGATQTEQAERAEDRRLPFVWARPHPQWAPRSLHNDAARAEADTTLRICDNPPTGERGADRQATRPQAAASLRAQC
jgi:hypothetical protein